MFDVLLFSLSSYFDAHGNYHVKEDTESFQDNWLQDVDWNKVRGGEEERGRMKREAVEERGRGVWVGEGVWRYVWVG